MRKFSAFQLNFNRCDLQGLQKYFGEPAQLLLWLMGRAASAVSINLNDLGTCALARVFDGDAQGNAAVGSEGGIAGIGFYIGKVGIAETVAKGE